jgi:hypothetical protein
MTTLRFLVICGLASGTAFAQPVPPDQVPADPVPPAPDPQPPIQPPQPPQPPVVRETVPEKTPDAQAPIRPDGFAIGIGVGYRFPTSLSIPNAASVRFRLPSGVTFEPNLVLASSSQTVDVGMPMGGSVTELGIGTLARFSVVGRRRTDLELLAAFNVDNFSEDPSDQNPDDVTSTTTTTFSYGLAVGLWITENLQMSLSATNALVSYTHVREEQGFEFVTVTNTTTYGLIFDPTVLLMVHLYN